MSQSHFVRPSKYRHVYGVPANKEVCYQNVKVTNNAWDTNLIAANKSYLSLNWQAGGGGAFAIIPTNHVGKLPDLYPLCRGHTASVLDTAFSPFDDKLVASASDDGTIGVWKVDDAVFDVLGMNAKELEKHGGVKDMSPLAKINASARKIGQVVFHPTAANTLAAAGGDHTIKLWDIEAQKDRSTLSGFTDAVQSLDFDWTGSTLVATCRDRKLRTFDPRKGGGPVQTTDGHSGIKGSRVIWCGSTDRIVTTGFSKTSDRQMYLWDSKDLAKPLKTQVIDSSSGIIMPFWSDNSIVFLAGKGDGNVRYYEIDNDEMHYLTEYQSTDPQRGMTFLPRRDLNATENEIARAYKVTNNLIQSISFRVPRRADSFQSDIYPAVPSSVPALSSDEFFAGKVALPNLVSLQDGQSVDSKEALPAGSSAPSPISAAPAPGPSPTPAAAPAPAKAPEPAAAAAPAPKAATQAPRADPLPEPRRVTPSSGPSTSGLGSMGGSGAAGATSTFAALRNSDSSSGSSSRDNGPTPAPASAPAPTQASAATPAPAPAGSAKVDIGGSEIASHLQRLAADSAARDARLRELEIENEKLKTERQRLREAAQNGDESSEDFSADRFFETQSPPANLADFADKARAFVQRHAQEGRRVVLVTSGGTTVPLERNVVRFLDNFSAGTRGATSAEYFLSQGYAVLFLHRQHSLCPYTRHYSHTVNPFLDLLDLTEDGVEGSAGSGTSRIRVHTSAHDHLEPVLRSYLLHSHEASQGGNGTLLRLPFVTVNDYLFLLREMSAVMQPLGRKGMYYLAAAVSDFFVPSRRTPEHKIQSGRGSLVIQMDQVPKVLNRLVETWAPEGYIVSFKLETDQALLIPKAQGALERYGHQVVVANDLNRRKEEVCFVSRGQQGTGYDAKWLRLADKEREIEEDIVQELVGRHEAWIGAAAA